VEDFLQDVSVEDRMLDENEEMWVVLIELLVICH